MAINARLPKSFSFLGHVERPILCSSLFQKKFYQSKTQRNSETAKNSRTMTEKCLRRAYRGQPKCRACLFDEVETDKKNPVKLGWTYNKVNFLVERLLHSTATFFVFLAVSQRLKATLIDMLAGNCPLEQKRLRIWKIA